MTNDVYSSGHESGFSGGNCGRIEAGWRKSTYSDANGGCVEAASAPDLRIIAVRDTRQFGRGPVLEFSATTWRTFIDDAKSGNLGLV